MPYYIFRCVDSIAKHIPLISAPASPGKAEGEFCAVSRWLRDDPGDTQVVTRGQAEQGAVS